MRTGALPSYAMLVLSAVILANIAAAWLIMLTMSKNKGDLYDQGPPWMVALSFGALLFCWYDMLLPAEATFWASAAFAAVGLWGAWADYTHLLDHFKTTARAKARDRTGSGS